MTKEQCSLQPNYYGSSCDFQDLQSAVQQLTTKSDAQFEELKNEKWFHRIFNMVVCPRKNNIRMAEQITSLAQAQGILIEILVRLADQDANIAGMVMQSQSDIRALAQNSAYLQERLYLLEDKSYGIKENENLKDLNSQQRNILSGCLNEASKLYAMPSNEQRLYANELLNYLNADAQVANLEDALDEKFDYPRAVVSDCSFTNCFAASDSLINEYFDFKPVFSKNRYYRLIRQENNYGLNNMRNPSDFVESNNVKLKETNASGKKIGSSMPVEWDDSEYTTCKMATTWLNTFNKA